MNRISIVDDNPVLIKVLRLGLESAGYEVDSSSDGLEFLKKLDHQAPDALITDIQMPNIGGKELCFSIEKQMPDRQFPIVVMTSRTEPKHEEWTHQISNLIFIEKPVSIRRLLAHLDECLNSSVHISDRGPVDS